MFFNQYLSYVKSIFADRLNQLLFPQKKYHFLTFYLAIFMGNPALGLFEVLYNLYYRNIEKKLAQPSRLVWFDKGFTS